MRRVLSCVALIVLVLVAALAEARRTVKGEHLTTGYSFERYVADYGKAYAKGSAEYARREAIFVAERDAVIAFNSQAQRTYTKGVNHMSDWTPAEFKAIRGARAPAGYTSKHQRAYASEPGVAIAQSIDWRQANPAVLTAVKDQGMCGDCWAHAVTEAVESAYARKTGDLYVLSQQQVTSCVPAVQMCGGCDGFFPQYAYDFLISKGQNASMGIVEEWYYSFTSWFGNTGTCLTNLTTPSSSVPSTVEISAFTQVTMNNQSAMIEALNHLGPLSILVDASAWQQYESGVFTGCATYDQGFALDHAVMVVGYGRDAAVDMDYWIVRNSWSAGWGEGGYVRIAKDNQPRCGDTYSINCVNQSHTQRACGPCGILTDAQFPTVNVTRRVL